MVRRLIRWFFVEPRYFWVALLLPTAAVAAIAFYPSEPAIRLTGLGVQLLGILTAVWGSVETLRYFDLDDPLRRLRKWALRCPFRKMPPITGSMMATEQNDALAARGYTSWPAKANAPVEERLERLEKNIPLLNERISNTQRELDTAFERLQHQVTESKANAEQVARHLTTRLTEFGTGSLHISAMGAFWVFVGSILGSASPELLALLR